ncbi:rod shape-determining protein RodA [Vibrio sp. Vb0888]|nr:rod shape-determining protein RodA [Vibrio sp. Vb0888]MDW1853561.1 rod shape-determining protein RodA [Vibrio sp. Vb0888]
MKMDPSTGKNRALFERFHIDLPLLLGIFALMGFGLVSMYSASGQSLEMMDRQAMRMVLSLVVMVVLAQLSPRTYESLAPLMFVAGVVLLFGVLFFGEASKGAQRWLNLGFVRFQPSELLKLAVPLMVARYIGRQPLPPTFRTLIVALIMVCLPTILIAKQPDLGTSILIAASGIFVIFLAGISWKIIAAAAIALGGFIPILWFFLMREYQKVRVRTLFNPESDPLGSGYQIIQSLIAIGSGGMKGKGWMNATQGTLGFIPESHTDFIFSTYAEEWGFIGCVVLLALYLFITARVMLLACQSEHFFSRLVSGTLAMSFFLYAFINTGMVSGLLPVMGSPLPFFSYGGTAMLTQGICFGVIMSLCYSKYRNT